MDRELEVIHKQMEATRESLTDKLGALESQVREGVQVANDTVTATVDGVKDVVSSVSDTMASMKESVADTVESVKETFNIHQQVEDHPWAAFGVAVAVGMAGGIFIGPSRATGAPPESTGSPSPAPVPMGAAAATAAGAALHGASGMMGKMFHDLQGLALGSLVGVARDLVKQSAPKEWQEGLSGVIDDLSLQLTGEKNPKSLLPSSLFAAKEAKDGSNHEGSTNDPATAWSGSGSTNVRAANGNRPGSQR